MSPTLLQSVVRIADARTADADLLDRFRRNRDERAFEEMVRRHGPLVWSVCRNLLPHHADAEDAFQAVFLALVRGAASIRAGHTLSAWLHGVAVRVAIKARRSTVRRKQREVRAAVPEANRPVTDAAWATLMTAVHEEIRQLPEQERTAFVLCDLEGVRQPDAAARLGWPLGTLSARLCKARRRLIDQLTRRGIAPTVLALGGVTGSAGSVPAALMNQVTFFPTAGAAGVSSTVVNLTRGLVEGTAMKTKMLAAALLVAGAFGLRGGALVLSNADAQDPGSKATAPRLGGPGTGDPPPSGGFTPRGPAGNQPGPRPGPGPGEGGPGGPGGPGGFGGPGGGGGMAVSFGSPSWEYKFVDKESDREAFEKTLTQLGKDGWEYCGSENLTSRRARPAPGENVMVFKRKKGADFPFGGGMGMPGVGGVFGGGGGGGRGGFGGFDIPGFPGDGGGGRVGGTDIEARTHRLRGAKADEVAKAIEKAFPKAKTLKAVPEPISNMIILVADAATMKDVLKLIEDHEAKAAPDGGSGSPGPRPPGGGGGGGPRGGGGAGGGPSRPPVPGGPGGGAIGPMGAGIGGILGGGSQRTGPIHVVILKHATAADMVSVVSRVFPNADLTADPRSNQLIFRGDDKLRTEIEELIRRLDVDVPKR